MQEVQFVKHKMTRFCVTEKFRWAHLGCAMEWNGMSIFFPTSSFLFSTMPQGVMPMETTRPPVIFLIVYLSCCNKQFVEKGKTTKYCKKKEKPHFSHLLNLLGCGGGGKEVITAGCRDSNKLSFSPCPPRSGKKYRSCTTSTTSRDVVW